MVEGGGIECNRTPQKGDQSKRFDKVIKSCTASNISQFCL